MTCGFVSTVLTFAALLGACVWVGGFVVIAVVVRVARQQLNPSSQVAFFRVLGRRYLPIGSAALALALGAGGGLLSSRRWDGTTLATVCVAGALIVTLAVGVVQARRMTRLRSRMLASPADSELASAVRRGAIRAALLRATIGLLSLTLLALAVVLASSSG